MKQVYGYIRVSTTEQVTGASLPEQKSAIEEYAKKNNLNIIHFYKESKTAAKKGRPLFLEMIENLKDGRADGVIMHKIDRSARNLHDWASVGDLIDNGIDVFFAHESLNMNERGGRLSADIQAVMASDYVRNLKQEIHKGIQGRLKQGYFPNQSPIGYVDNGKGQKKTIDKDTKHLVEDTFNLYLNGEYNIEELAAEMSKRGLVNKRGNKVCKNGMTRILRNPFYTGLMKVRDKIYQGNHEPLIDKRIFDEVQEKMNFRVKSAKSLIHDYLFRMHIRCAICNYVMSGSLKKGMVYYRCKKKNCKTKCIRQDHVELSFKRLLRSITLTKKEAAFLEKIVNENKESSKEIQEKLLSQLSFEIKKIQDRKDKLLDIYMDDVIDKAEYEKRRESFIIKLNELKNKKSDVISEESDFLDRTLKLVELCKNPLKVYDLAFKNEKRQMIKIISSNLTINGRSIEFSTVSPFYELIHRDILLLGAQDKDTIRKLPSKIVYSNINTSAIVPKPLNREKLNKLFNYLMSISKSINIPNMNIINHELQKNDPNT